VEHGVPPPYAASLTSSYQALLMHIGMHE